MEENSSKIPNVKSFCVKESFNPQSYMQVIIEGMLDFKIPC